MQITKRNRKRQYTHGPKTHRYTTIGIDIVKIGDVDGAYCEQTISVTKPLTSLGSYTAFHASPYEVSKEEEACDMSSWGKKRIKKVDVVSDGRRDVREKDDEKTIKIKDKVTRSMTMTELEISN